MLFATKVRDLVRRSRAWRLPAPGLPQVAAVVLVAELFLLAMTGAGRALERRLFLAPFAAARAALGWAPTLDARLRIILVDDRALKKLGRQPRFDEWLAVSDHLVAMGFETCLLLGFYNLAEELGDVTRKPAAGRVYTGVAAIDDPQNTRALPAERMIAFQPLVAANAAAARGFETVPALLGTAPEAQSLATGLGAIGVNEDSTFPYAYHIGDGYVVPQIAFWAEGALAVREGALASPAGAIPRPADGRVLVDYVPWADALAHAVPMTAFYDATGQKVLGPSKKLRAALSGGKVALLVPSAFSGGRFVEGPLGRVPSYVATASLASAVLSGKVLASPVRLEVALAAVVLLVWALAIQRRRWALGATATLAVLLLAAGVAAYCAAGVVLPVAGPVTLALSGFLLSGTAAFLRGDRERYALTRELELGSLVQALILPEVRSGTIGGWDYACTYRPYGPMAGDWFLAHEYSAPRDDGGEDKLAVLAIGDVVGKGASAALLTAAIATVWDQHRGSWSANGGDAGAFLSGLDATIATLFKRTQNSTISLLVLRATDVLAYAVGAPPMIVVDPAVRLAQRVRTPASNPLGLLGRVPPKPLVVAVPRGATICAFTDGVLDGTAARMRLAEAVRTATAPLDDFATLAALFTAAGAPDVQPDDFTLLLARRRPGEAAASEEAA